MAISLDELPDLPTTGGQAPAAPAAAPAPALVQSTPKRLSLNDLPDLPASGAPAQTPTNAPQSTIVKLDDLPDDPAVAAKQNEVKRLLTMNDAQLKSAMKDGLMPRLERFKQSPVGQALDPLMIPMRVITAGAVWGLDKFSPGIQQKLNPNGEMKPDIAWNDVINYYAPSEADVRAYAEKNGFTPITVDRIEKAYWGTKLGVGLIANFYGDPLRLVNVGQLTKDAELIYKAGNVEKGQTLERNLVSVRAPFTEMEASVPLKPIKDAATSAIDSAGAKIRSVPGGAQALDATKEAATKAKNAVTSFLDTLNPWTGETDIDMARSGHKVLQRGDFDSTLEYLNQAKRPGFSDAENKVAAAAMEKTPNLKLEGIDAASPATKPAQAPKQVPNNLAALEEQYNKIKSQVSPEQAKKIEDKIARIKEVQAMNASIVAEARVKPSVSLVESPKGFGATENDVRAALYQHVELEAKRLGVSLAPGRVDDLVEGVMLMKKDNALILSKKVQAGALDVKDLNTSTIEGYLRHEVSPQARDYMNKNPELAAAYEEALIAKDLNKVNGGVTISGFDPGRKGRTIRTTLEEANDIMKQKTAGKVDKWFIEDPFVATAMQNSRTRKFLRDKELIESIAPHGVRPKNATEAAALRKKGYQPILIPDFEGQKILIKDGDKFVRVNQQDVLFPGRIASKLSYDLIPRGSDGFMGNVNAYMDSYNRVFRRLALARPDYYLENWTDNLLKNYVNGVKLEDYSDAYKIAYGKPTDIIKVAGKEVPVSQMRDMLKQWNIKSTHFTEDMEAILFTGKKIANEQSLLSRAKVRAQNSAEMASKVLTGMHEIGIRGENFTRTAFFLNRIKRGYAPVAAAHDVEKFLFDFGRTTPGIDFARRFYQPFIQAAVKTAQIAPALIAKRPSAINFYENLLMKTIQDSFNDPATSWAVQELYPAYYRIHDRVAGQLLPGNHWLAIMAGADPNSKTQLPVAIAYGLPGGLGILNQFLTYDGLIMKQSASSPVMRSLGILFYGKDPWTGKDIDLTKDQADVAARLNWAAKKFMTSALAVPNIEKMILQKYGVGDPKYFQSDTILMFHGAMGKFARVTNLDREFQFKLFALASAEKELRKQLYSAASAEMLGKTPDIAFAKNPSGKMVANQFAGIPHSSAEIYAKMTNRIAEQKIDSLARQQLLDQKKSPEQLAAMIWDIHKTADNLNNAYRVSMQNYFNMLKEAKDDRAKQAIIDMATKSSKQQQPQDNPEE